MPGEGDPRLISQDTSAYGVDLKYRTGLSAAARPVKTRMLELVEELAKLGVWVRLHYVYPYPSVDDVIPSWPKGRCCPIWTCPFQHASHPHPKAETMKRPAHAENVLRRIEKWRESARTWPSAAPSSSAFPGVDGEDFDELLDFLEAAQLDRVGAFAYSPWMAPRPTPCRTRGRGTSSRTAWPASWTTSRRTSAPPG